MKTGKKETPSCHIPWPRLHRPVANDWGLDVSYGYRGSVATYGDKGSVAAYKDWSWIAPYGYTGLFHMVGMVRFCGAVFPYGFEGAPVRILGMVPGPGLSCGLSYAVGIRKPFQVINILPLSPGDNWDGFRRGAANTAPWDASGLFLLYWAMDVSCGKRLGKGVVFSLHLDFQGGGNKGHTGGRAANARAMFPGKGKEGYAQIVDKAC